MPIAPYQARVIDEKSELDARILRLKGFIDHNAAFPRLQPLQQDLMKRQLWVMTAYSTCLRERIDLWNLPSDQ